MAEAAGSVDGAEQRHQNRQRAYRLEAVGMRRQTAHRMEGHRIAGDAVVFLAPRVGPGDRQFDLLVARRDAHLVGETADGLDRNAGDLARPFRGVILYPFLQQLESGLDRRAVGQLEFAEQEWIGSLAVRDDRLIGIAIPPQLVLRVVTALLFRHLGAHEHAEFVMLVVEIHQLAGVGVAHQKIAVVQTERDDLVDQREQQRAVGAGTYAHPFVGDRRVAGAYRVDGNEAAALALEFRDRDLHRIGVMVFGRADHHEQLGALQIRPAEFPERTADGVDHSGGHVHRTEAAVSGIVGRAELARKQSGQRLHLVAPGEQREFLRIGGAYLSQPLGENIESLFPADLLEFAGTAVRPGLRRSGLVSRAGEYCFMMPELPLAQITPLLSG